MLAPIHTRSGDAEFRLLYLGSDLELVKAMRTIFKDPRYRLVTCSDRHSAMLFLKSKIPYQLLVIDLDWRETQDWKLAKLAHRLRHRKRMPKILVSGKRLTSRVKAMAQEVGVIACIPKIKVMTEVTETISRLL